MKRISALILITSLLSSLIFVPPIVSASNEIVTVYGIGLLWITVRWIWERHNVLVMQDIANGKCMDITMVSHRINLQKI